MHRPAERRAALAGLALALCAVSAAAQDPAPATAAPETSARRVNLYAERCARDPARWILTSLASPSRLSDARPDWLEMGVELLYRANPELYVGGRVESRKRNDTTDVLYTALLSHTPMPAVEWHAAVTWVPDPAFSIDRGYTLGGEWRFARPLSVQFDYSHLDFPAGAIDQYKPGLVWWFSECNFLTGRYARGHAFGSLDYDAWLLRLDLGDTGLPLGARIALSYAHGTEPEKQVGFPAILTTADSYALYTHWPVATHLDLIVGAEYEDRKDLYTRTTGTVGISLRF